MATSLHDPGGMIDLETHLSHEKWYSGRFLVWPVSFIDMQFYLVMKFPPSTPMQQLEGTALIYNGY